MCLCKGFLGGSVKKNLRANAGDTDSIPGLVDHLEEEMATHPSSLAWKNSMDREAWKATVHGVAKSRTQLSMHTCNIYAQVLKQEIH